MSDDDLPPETFQLPLPAFVAQAAGWVAAFDWAKDDDLPFHFVRVLKAHSSFKGADAARAYQTLAAHIHVRKAFSDFGLGGEDGEVLFHSLWERVRFPMGTDPVVAACAVAGDGLLRTRKERPGRYSRFLTVAALLQIQVRQKPILLPVRKIAEHMPCEPNSISSWTGWAIQDEVLVKTGEHAFRSKGASRAAEYVFALHRWNQTTLAELAGLLGLTVRQQDLNWTHQVLVSKKP